jgi:spermidine/putrescine transport system permease protein
MPSRSRGRGRGRLRPYVLLAPMLAILLFGVVVPLASFLLYSFWRKAGFEIVQEFTLHNYVFLAGKMVYLRLIGKAILYGFIVAAATLFLAYPLAYVVATRVKAEYKNLVLLAVLVPLYTSDIVRIFAWRSVLGVNGFINQTLISLGLISEPIEGLLFSPFAALISLTHMMFPFMFLAVWAGLETMKGSLVESAMDLGAGPLRVLRRIVIPLSLPGVLAGFLFVFIPVTGDYVYVNLMGGPTGVTVTKAIVQQFGAANNWPFASTLATAMLLAMLVTIALVGGCASRLRSIRMYFASGH